MSDFARLSADEIIAESQRRTQRRKKGLTLAVTAHDETPTELAKRIADDDMRLEREIQRDVVRLYRAHGCIVYEFSQKRASKQTPGIGDLYIFNPELHAYGPAAWWHEVKTATGRLRPDQNVFGELCQQCRVWYVVGGVAAAEAQLARLGMKR